MSELKPGEFVGSASISDLRAEAQARLVTADEFDGLLNALVEWSAWVADKTVSRLSRVSRPETNDTNVCRPPESSEPWPPLFSCYRDKVQRVRNYLLAIDEALDRLEL